jgi:phosphoglucomutase
MTRAFYNLRHTASTGISYIHQFGELGIARIHDVSLDYDSATGQALPVDKPLSPSAEMVTFELEDGTVMTLRGSGTEPKLKYYIEANGRSLEEAQKKAKVVEGSLLGVFRGMGLAV